MGRFFILLIILYNIIIPCKGQSSKRGFVCPYKEPIPIYETVTSFSPTTFIVSGNTDYSFYYAYIIDESYLRFKAIIMSSDDDANNSEFIEGWINKTNVIVRPLESGYDEQGGFLYLYDAPNSKDFIKIYTSNMVRDAMVLNFYEDTANSCIWKMVIIQEGDATHVGWIDHVCENIWSTCN